MNYELIEDVLNTDTYEELNNKFNGSFFPWFYNDSTIPSADNNFMFTHHIYRNGQISSEYFNDILPVLFEVGITTGKSKLLRVKANLYTNQNKKIYHATHTDFPDLEKYYTAVYNFTDCNGGTVLFINDEEVVIPSIKNSLLVFDGNITHQGFTQTDKNNRVLLNIDFM
tara:strand:+ start:433 stop:939 length:507 start_codon:yes stop_codon:yes gene_type:complete